MEDEITYLAAQASEFLHRVTADGCFIDPAARDHIYDLARILHALVAYIAETKP